MAYETGTASTIEAFMQAFHDFAVAQGWTSNIFSTTNDWCAINNGTEFYQFRWDNTNGIAIFHSTAFDGTGVYPGNHTGSSAFGQVDTSAPYNATVSDYINTTTVTNNRQQMRTNSNGPFTAYHFFAPASGQQYIHAVLEVSPNEFRHMSIGTINKRGDWTGGGYSAGCGIIYTTVGIFGFGATSPGQVTFAIRAQGLTGLNVNTRWLGNVSTSTGTPNLGNDLAGNPRGDCLVSGSGGGLLGQFMEMSANPANGLIPLLPIDVWYRYTVSSTDRRWMLLGYIPDAYTFNMTFYAPGDEFSVAGDTFKVFPARQQGLATANNGQRGVAYRKVV